MKRGQIGGVIRSSILGALLLGGALGEAQSLRGGIGLCTPASGTGSDHTFI